MVNLKKYEAMTKLALTEEERVSLSTRIDAMFKSFDALDAIDTDGVTPMVTVLDAAAALREDTAVKSFSREEILANAPSACDGYFQVPKTID